MTDDQLELANAYLDGEATADERARVESDAELLAEVERLRSIRNVLSEIDPPSANARESAIAAALATFERLPSTVVAPVETTPLLDATAPTNIVPFERRRRLRRLQGLSAAAAAVVIVAGGITIAQRDGGSNDADVRATNPAVDAQANTERDETASGESPAPTSVATSTTNGATMAVVPTTAGYEDGASDQAAGDASSSDPDSAEIAPPAPTVDAAAEVPAMPAAPAPAETLARFVVLRSDDDLVDFAATMKDQPVAEADAAAECEDDTLKADAVYQDEDGAEHPIVVVLLDDEDEDEQLGALSLDDCTIVLQAD